MAEQLSLDVSLKDDATFENFYASGNEAAVNALEHVVNNDLGSSIYLWGGDGVGRTHLLQAVSHVYSKKNKTIMYLPLKDNAFFSPDILQGMEHLDLVALDDIDAIAGNALWEEALFHFYNRAKESRAQLVVTANDSVRQVPLQLADLRSRLSHGLVFHLHALNDDEKIRAVQMRANNRGLDMPKDVAEFLLKRLPRDMNGLFQVLDTLDKASIKEQRRLTIPFVKKVMA